MSKFIITGVIILVAVFVVFAWLTWKGEEGVTQFVSDNVVVDQPLQNSIIKSPVTIKGKARGIWYFEASFPVSATDENGQVLGNWYAQAQSDWMTADFVPFESVLTFKTPATKTGYIILSKDNPSGLPEHDAEVKVPVRFE